MRPALLPAALGLAFFISALPARAQSPDCAPVLNASATAAENEIQFLRNNVRKPQSIGALTCLSLFASISNLSADYIVNSFIEGIFDQIISQKPVQGRNILASHRRHALPVQPDDGFRIAWHSCSSHRWATGFTLPQITQVGQTGWLTGRYQLV